MIAGLRRERPKNSARIQLPAWAALGAWIQ